MTRRGAPFPGNDCAERCPIAGSRERWAAFLGLEHATLTLPTDFSGVEEELIVVRRPSPGRPVSDGRIPRSLAPALLLQAASAASFFQSCGIGLEEEDLRKASWDSERGTPRLWLPGPPAAVRRQGPGLAVAEVLASFLDRLFARGRPPSFRGARELLERLKSKDAGERRPEFWLAETFRAFPELGAPEAAGARARTLGSAGTYLKSPAHRAILEKARALLDGRVPRVFGSAVSAAVCGGALALEDGGAVMSLRRAIRALRERHRRESAGRRARWIAVDPERWDLLSRRAFESAAQALGDEVEVVLVPASTPPPLLADEWRREIFVPCGTIHASLRFYERFAELARAEPSAAWGVAESFSRAPEWAAFVADPRGEAPLPRPPADPGSVSPPIESVIEAGIAGAIEIAGRPVRSRELARLFTGQPVEAVLARLENAGCVERDPAGNWRSGCRTRISPLSASRREELSRRWAALEDDPVRRVELLLAGGETESALSEARLSVGTLPPAGAGRWFGMSALLANAIAGPLPAWLEILEAERHAAGGLLEDAGNRLRRLEESGALEEAGRRAIRLRLAEITSERGRFDDAARKAGEWRREFPGAPVGEGVRAMVLEARGRARRGDHAGALALLDDADRAGAALSLGERLESALARAGVLSLAGRFREEDEIYDRWRVVVGESEDDELSARLLSRQALGLADRREFAAAAARLEEALEASKDDPIETARLSINLASTLYHSGRRERCRRLLDDAVRLASSAGREDLARTARGNRLELMIDGGEWDRAAAEVEALADRAVAEGDDSRLLVALHHRSRMALRRGNLESAAEDNARARGLAEKLNDRLETGELLLEDGDRRLYEGDLAGARQAWEAAASDPPDRCDSAERARRRLDELAWATRTDLPEPARRELASLFERDEYSAAEQTARWHVIFQGKLDPSWRIRADRVLRARGGDALARKVFGSSDGAESAGIGSLAADLRDLREAVAGAFAGEEREAPLAALGLSGLILADSDSREILRLGRPDGGASRRQLDAGASSYELTLSPAPSEGVLDAIALVLETLLFRIAHAEPPSDFAEGWRRLGVVAADVSMAEPYRRLVRLAPSPVTVLVLGESGSGKEAVARAVHALSPRARRAFVAVNVPAVPPALLESELFGHARGAFTGADRDRTGLLEEAEGGTIFFDEIGDLSAPLQAKLLRALQEREIRRVGENRARRLDVRVVSATARDLEREVEAGRFREDLYYRLHVAVIALPPLRDRGRDVALLARHFLERCSRDFSRGRLAFAPETLSILSAHSWPGNVRELQNVVSQAAALAAPGAVVGPDLLPEDLRRRKAAELEAGNYRARVNRHRRGLVCEALERAGGNRSKAARDLGLSRQALAYLIRELDVAPRTPAAAKL